MELVLILGIALLLFGPSRLPGLGKSMGDAIRGFKKGIDGDEEKQATIRPEQLRDASAVDAHEQKSTEKNTEKKS